MKATKSGDGLRRFNLIVTVRMDAELAATLLTAYDYDLEEETPAEYVARKMKLGKRKLVEEIKTTAINRGTESPWYAISDGSFDAAEHRDALAAALRKEWDFD